MPVSNGTEALGTVQVASPVSASKHSCGVHGGVDSWLGETSQSSILFLTLSI
jgi:hypothetical protein